MMNREAFDASMCRSQLDGTHGASARWLALQGVCREGGDVGVIGAVLFEMSLESLGVSFKTRIKY